MVVKKKFLCLYTPITIMIIGTLMLMYLFSSQTLERHSVTKSSVQNVSKQNVVPNLKDKYLIYLCDEGRYCGGWADRQRGIVSLFLLSLAFNRKFRIVYTSPCNIKSYYEPTKEFNWTLTKEELEGLKGRTTASQEFFREREPLLLKVEMNSSKTADVLYIRTNHRGYEQIAKKYAGILPKYLFNKGRAQVFVESWKRIMSPKDRLVNQVMKIRSKGEININAKKSGTELVCAHLRIGRSAFFPNDYVGLSLEKVPEVWSFIDKAFPRESRIFVATDHPDVRKSAISRYGKRYIGSYAFTMNPDNMRSNLTLACSSQESAYVDQLMLSKCDALLYCGVSGFSIHATYLKTNWTNIYHFNGNTANKVFLG